MRRLVLTAAAVALLAAAQADARSKRRPPEGTERLTVETDAGQRRSLVEPRKRDAVAGVPPPPLLIVLHDAGQRPRDIREIAAFQPVLPGWTIAYPEAVEKVWNVGRKGVGGQPLLDTDDIAFMVELISALAAEGRADPDRVFFAGFGEGGMLAELIGCEAPKMMKGMAVVMAGWPPSLVCRFPTPIPAIHFNSRHDPAQPWEGGQVRPELRQGSGLAASNARGMENVARRNGCGGYQEARRPGDVRLRIWSACLAPLIQWVSMTGGHRWPGSTWPASRRRKAIWDAKFGPPVAAPDATGLIRSLFESLAKPRRP